MINNVAISQAIKLVCLYHMELAWHASAAKDLCNMSFLNKQSSKAVTLSAFQDV